MHYDGNSWAMMSSPLGESLFSIWGISGDDVYAVGYTGEILHYTIADGWKSYYKIRADILRYLGQLSRPMSSLWASTAGYCTTMAPRHNGTGCTSALP